MLSRHIVGRKIITGYAALVLAILIGARLRDSSKPCVVAVYNFDAYIALRLLNCDLAYATLGSGILRSDHLLCSTSSPRVQIAFHQHRGV